MAKQKSSENSTQDSNSKNFLERLKDLRKRSEQTNANLDKLREETHKMLHPDEEQKTADDQPE